MKVNEIYGRGDLALIGDMVPPRSRVLDLGCGDGALLEWLKANKQVDARGVEIDRALVQKAIARGVSVYQGDVASSIEDYPDGAFDYVILSQTLQQMRYPLEVLKQMLRVGKRSIVAFPNFGHWRVRLSHLFSGRSPRTPLFPFDWYNTPNIHFLTIIDFEDLIARQGWKVERRRFVAGTRTVERFPNLLAEVAVYMIRAD